VSDPNISEPVRQFILQEFLPGEKPEALKLDTPLVTGGILDSIATLKLVSFLEERFDIRLAAHEAGVDHMDTIASIAALVASKKK
jgi:acyl carrier protein